MRFSSHCLSFVIEAVCGFIAPDLCHICGGEWTDAFLHSRPPRRRAALIASPVERRLAGMAVRSHPLCPRCAACLAESSEVVELGEGLALVAPFLTGEMLLKIVHTIKFRRHRELAEGAALAMAASLSDLPGVMRLRPALVPVPMDSRSRAKRGFNQSAELAAAIGGTLGLDVLADALIKPRRTRPQSLMERDRRADNVRHAFSPGKDSPGNRHVVVIDDIVTTGATVRACAAVLLSAGAASVVALSLGRSPLAGHRDAPKTPFLLS